jgi:MoaA/NifB/PqqE/SkfB family radical SAM enzyme
MKSKSDILITTFNKLVNQKQARHFLTKKIDKYIYKNVVENDTTSLKKVQLKKYEFLSAMLSGAVKDMDKGYISKNVVNKLVEVLVKNSFMKDAEGYETEIEKFKQKYGVLPPSFIVISPTQRCNLNCIGCYASSTSRSTTATIPYSVVDKIVEEVHDTFGSRFITVSGGEPFMYRSEGKTLLDIFEKYNDMFFLVYTNGTLITPEIAKRLEILGNATPAISVEGLEKETDERRGEGIFKKVLNGFNNLREAGVPFGMSVTATSKNVELLLKDEFYDFYFNQQGASYMWQFQLMPIGRGKEVLDLMVTPDKRVQLYRMWEKMLKEKKYCLADFWNSGVLSNGCIAYGRSGGYVYVDWNGNIMPCVFVPYYVDNIYDLYKNGKTLSDALFSDLMKNGRQWQNKYGLENMKRPMNWLMPCSIRDHYEVFRKSILTDNAKPEDKPAKEALESDKYYETLVQYDSDLEKRTGEIWRNEYLKI